MATQTVFARYITFIIHHKSSLHICLFPCNINNRYTFIKTEFKNTTWQPKLFLHVILHSLFITNLPYIFAFPLVISIIDIHLLKQNLKTLHGNPNCFCTLYYIIIHHKSSLHICLSPSNINNSYIHLLKQKFKTLRGSPNAVFHVILHHYSSQIFLTYLPFPFLKEDFIGFVKKVYSKLSFFAQVEIGANSVVFSTFLIRQLGEP